MPLKYTTNSTGKAVPIIIADNVEQAEQDHEQHAEILGNRAPARPLDTDTGTKRLAEAAGLTEDQTRHVFEFEHDGPILISTLNGSEDERIKKACLALLAARDFVYGEREVLSSTTKKAMRNAGINISTSFGSNLLTVCKGLILPIGARHSPTLKHKLTTPGRQEGLRIIRELAGGAANA